MDFDVEMQTRDGVTLRADVIRPDIKTKVPAILLRTPYGKAGRTSMNRFFPHIEGAQQGFASVFQDVRGRYASEGEWAPVDWGGVEGRDGHDAVEWVASEPWCNGNVGMIGGSYAAG